MNERAKYLIRTGICTTDLGTRPAREMFRFISDCGFGAIQFGFSSVTDTMYEADGNIEIPDCELMLKAEPDALKNISKAAYDAKLVISAVNGTFNAAHPDSEIRLEGVRRFDSFTVFSKELGAEIITLCSGTRCPTHLWTYDESNNTPEAWNDMTDTMKRLVEIAEKRDITLAIETEVSNIVSSPKLARKVMDEVGSDKLKMILDAANLFPAGCAKKGNVHSYLREAFDYFGHDIVLAHGKDIRESDGIDFCGTGEGIVDFSYMAKLLSEYGFTGDMMLHGIYDDSKYITAREHWENCIQQ